MNFIAFQFSDNDFSDVLLDAISFIASDTTLFEVDPPDCTMIKDTCVMVMQAYYTLRNISRNREFIDRAEYFKKNLIVFEARSMKELEERDHGEGLAYDKHTTTISYWGG